MAVNVSALKLAIARKCYNVPQLAEKAGVKPLTIHCMLSNSRKPNFATIGKVAKALDVDVTEIVTMD